MKRIGALLVLFLAFSLAGCATSSQQPIAPASKSPSMRAVVPFDALNEAARKEALKMGYKPGDTVIIVPDERGEAKIIHKQ